MPTGQHMWIDVPVQNWTATTTGWATTTTANQWTTTYTYTPPVTTDWAAVTGIAWDAETYDTALKQMPDRFQGLDCCQGSKGDKIPREKDILDLL